MAQRVQAGRHQLQTPEPPVDAQWRHAPAYPGHQHHHQRAQQRRDEDEGHRLGDAGPHQLAGTGLGHHRTDDAADQRVRAGRRDAVPPGDQVPEAGTHQGTEDHMVVDDARLDDALANGGGHLQLEDADGDDVEKSGEQHRALRLEHAGGHDGGDGIRRVVEAVHEVEGQCQHNEQHNDPDTDLDGIHGRGLRGGRIRNSRGRCPRQCWPRPRSGRRWTPGARRPPSA